MRSLGLQSVNLIGNQKKTSSAPVLDKVLDGYNLADVFGAYSLRQLTSNYGGSAVRVRRGSDNAEEDIGFLSNGDLDKAALETHVGVGNNGYVVTWYDQSNNQFNFTESTADDQPPIVINGLATMNFNQQRVVIDWRAEGNNTKMDMLVSFTKADVMTNDELSWIFVTEKENAGGTQGIRFGDDGLSWFDWTGSQLYMGWGNASTRRLQMAAPSGWTTDNLGHLVIATTNTGATTGILRLDGDETTHGLSGSTITPSSLQLSATNAPWRSSMPELIMLNRALTSQEITDLESNINTYYGLY